MGKKRIIKETKEELFKAREKIDKAMKKEVKRETLPRIKEGKIYIFSSYNNTILTLTDMNGNVLHWASAGSLGFKGARKATPFAASKVAESMSYAAKKLGIEKVAVLVKGVGGGRGSALKSLSVRGLNIISLKDITPIPHNGCRPRKVRRV